MTRLVGFAGSLRRESFNRALINAAAQLMPDHSQLEVLSIDEVPLYNADTETDAGIPASVAGIKQAIEHADGLVIATPEYNNGIPGVAKNVMDWVSRPIEDQARVLYGKPVALVGATAGRFGTICSQTAWMPVFRMLRMRLWVGGGPFVVPSAFESVEHGKIVDAELAARLRAYLAGFVASIGNADLPGGE